MKKILVRQCNVQGWAKRYKGGKESEFVRVGSEWGWVGRMSRRGGNSDRSKIPSIRPERNTCTALSSKASFAGVVFYYCQARRVNRSGTSYIYFRAGHDRLPFRLERPGRDVPSARNMKPQGRPRSELRQNKPPPARQLSSGCTWLIGPEGWIGQAT